MALDVGSVVATVGARFDDRGFDQWERRVDQARRGARNPVEQKLGADLDAGGFKRFDSHVDASEHKARRGFGAMGAAAGVAKAGIVGAVAGAGLAVVGMGSQFIDTASDISESLAKNGVLFGRYAKDVEQFSDQSARSFGISKQAALEYTGTFGNLARAIGISQKDSSKIAVDLTKQAADMASFNNTTIEDALDALRSGLVGESEPLRRFGVTLSANSVAAEAMSSGIVKVDKSSTAYRKSAIDVEKAQAAVNAAVKAHGAESLEARDANVALKKAQEDMTKTAKGGRVELTAQQKTQATLSLITKQTAAAQGDFARTSGGLANQQRILKARLGDAGVELGTKLLPVALKVAKGLNALLDQGDKLSGMFGRAKRAFSGFSDGTGESTSRIGQLVGKVRDQFEAFRSFIVTTFNRVSKVFAGSGDDFRAFGNGILNVLNFIVDAIYPVVRAVLPGLSRAIEGIAVMVRGVVRIIGGILTGDWSRAWKGAKDVVSGAFKVIRGVAEGALGGLEQMFKRTGGLIAGAMSKVLEVFGDIVGAGSKLPGVGGKFKDMADAIHRAQGRVDNLRDSFRDTDKDARKGAGGVSKLKSNIASTGDVSRETAAAIAGDLNEVLKGVGAKPVKFSLKSGSAALGRGNSLGGFPQPDGLAVGGIPNPGSGSADDHMLIGPDGRPVAMMSGTEGVFNTPQMELANTAFQLANAAFGWGPGSLSGMWGMGLRHYAAGGILARANTLDRMELPYVWGGHHGDRGRITNPRPGLDCSSAVSYVLGIPPRVSSGFMNYGKPGPGAVTIYSNPEHAFMSIGGRGFGTSGENPGGGPGWLSYSSRPGFSVRHIDGDVGGGQVSAPTINGPAGPWLDALRASGRKMAAAGNRYVDSQLGAFDSAGGDAPEGSIGKGGLMRLWSRAGGPGSERNTAGAVGMAESRGILNAQGPMTKWGRAKGLWQILGQVVPGNIFDGLVNAKNAVSKWRSARGWSPWEAFTNGNYRSFLNRGGLLAGLKRFAPGGPLGGGAGLGPAAGNLKAALGQSSGPLTIRALRSKQGDRIGEYDDELGGLEDERKHYEQTDRRYGQSEEVLVDEKTGAIDWTALRRRATELGNLKKIRERIARRLRHMRTIAKRVVKTYTTLINRLTASLKHAKKKDRAGIRKSITHYTDARGEWRDKLHDLGFDVTDADLDITDVANERAEVLATKAEPPDVDDQAAGGDLTPDAALPDASSPAPDAAAAPDPDLAAVAAQATARSAGLEKDLAATRASLTAFGSSGDIGAGGGRNAFATVAGPGAGAAFGAPAYASVNVSVASFVPPTGAQQAELGKVVAAALSAQPSVPSTREVVG